jgi:hypothetical protein
MSATTTHITVRVPLRIRRRAGRKTLVTPVVTDGATTQPTRADPALVKALARGFRYQRLLDEGRYATISEMAAAERLERGYLGSLLRLTLLAPEVVEAILNGTLPHGSTFADFEGGAPALWEDQRALFGRVAGAAEAASPRRTQLRGLAPQPPL